MKKYDLIIFDCDGTLVNSHDMNHSIMAEVANRHGDLSYTMKSVEEEYLGIDYLRFFKMVAEKENISIPESAAEECVELALKNIASQMQKIDGAYEVLERLAPHTKLNVASNANKTIVLNSLSAVGIDKFFNADHVVAGRAMATPKPAPDLFLLAAEKMETSPDKCLVIEDSKAGVQGAVAAGMDVWGFTGAAHDKKERESELERMGATAIFDRLIHIADSLGY